MRTAEACGRMSRGARCTGGRRGRRAERCGSAPLSGGHQRDVAFVALLRAGDPSAFGLLFDTWIDPGLRPHQPSQLHHGRRGRPLGQHLRVHAPPPHRAVDRRSLPRGAVPERPPGDRRRGRSSGRPAHARRPLRRGPPRAGRRRRRPGHRSRGRRAAVAGRRRAGRPGPRRARPPPPPRLLAGGDRGRDEPHARGHRGHPPQGAQGPHRGRPFDGRVASGHARPTTSWPPPWPA